MKLLKVVAASWAVGLIGCASMPLAEKPPKATMLGKSPSCNDDGCRYTYSMTGDPLDVVAFYGTKGWCWARFTSTHLTDVDRQTHDAVEPDIATPDGLTSAEIEHIPSSDEVIIHMHQRPEYRRAVCYKKISDSPTPPPPPDGAPKYSND